MYCVKLHIYTCGESNYNRCHHFNNKERADDKYRDMLINWCWMGTPRIHRKELQEMTIEELQNKLEWKNKQNEYGDQVEIEIEEMKFE